MCIGATITGSKICRGFLCFSFITFITFITLLLLFFISFIRLRFSDVPDVWIYNMA